MSDIFINSNNFKEYMAEAMNIYVASAYFSKNIIETIKADLNQLPQKGGRNFRFILNQDFHEDPSMRQVLINKLLELPNTEVRIYKGKRFFHPKLYIFESGNNMFTAIGSFNATAGGAGASIEAGVRLENREIYKQAKAFFDQYWESPDTDVAKSDEFAVFMEKKFKVGDGVTVISTNELGIIYNSPPEFLDNEWIYSVFVNGTIKKVSENDLKHIEITDYRDESSFIEEPSEKEDFREWAKNYILEKAFDLTDKTQASFASSRTETYPYQFKPLFKITNSKYHRLLVADEVGLGKTIEAGIILKEFSCRSEMDRILIIVPNSLKFKWRDELQIRFDEYYDIITGKDLLSFFEDYDRAPSGAIIKGIISYDQLKTRALQDKLENMSDMPYFDMFIIDEVHNLKNESTKRYKVIKKITQNAKSIIMLSATPIQLGTGDLYNILNILVPDVYVERGESGFRAQMTVNERINKAINLLKRREFATFKEIINELKETRAFRRELELNDNYLEIIERCLDCNERLTDSDIRRLAIELYELNVLNQCVTRTLRKEVALSFPDRDVRTLEYEYSETEKEVYDEILNFCRKKRSQGSSAFSMIMPERRAASSLIAMINAIKTEKKDILEEEDLDTVEESSDD
jgi:HKD family nuclease